MLKPSVTSVYSARELHACALRELKLREKVYPNRVLTGRMSRQQAETEIFKMQAIVNYFAELAQAELLV